MNSVFFVLFTTILFYNLQSIATSKSTEDYLNKCITSVNHKQVPGPEGKALESYHCKPWQNHSCCTWNTTSQVNQDGTLSLYGIVWDQCPKKKNMSESCKKNFMRDTCFYECSPNLGPWIVTDPKSKKTRKERVKNVPLCAADCDKWFADCSDDYTCNGNWGTNWNWAEKGKPEMCPSPYTCKRFKEYFQNAKEFCEMIFDNSFKYETNKDKCMNLLPVGDKNKDVALRYAEELSKKSCSVGIQLKSFLLFLSWLLLLR